MNSDWKLKCSLLSMIVSCYSNSSGRIKPQGFFSHIIFIYTD